MPPVNEGTAGSTGDEWSDMTASEKQDDMTAAANDADEAPAPEDGATWGPKLFWITLVLILVFFWWLLIYSGGVEVHHPQCRQDPSPSLVDGGFHAQR